MLSIGLALSGDRQLETDVTQEAFVRAYRRWPDVREMDAPRAWLRRVMINLLIDAHRRTMSERAALDRIPSPTAVAFDDPIAGPWWDAVRELPERQRAAVALHYLDDHSVAEVAEVLGIAEGTVKASLASARRTLAKAIGAEEAG